MAKGELEKRIIKRIKTLTDYYGGLQTITISDIVNKAREEFPKLGVGGSNNIQDIKNYSESIEEALSIALVTLEEIKEWFEKWFDKNG